MATPRRRLGVVGVVAATVLCCSFFVVDALELQGLPGRRPSFTFCRSVTIEGGEDSKEDLRRKLEALEGCNVIEGHLRLHRIRLPPGASFGNLTQVTDYVVLERVRGVTSLSKLFPRLAVVRGEVLFFDDYAFVLHANIDLLSVGTWGLKVLKRGAVHVEDNVLLCTDEELEWRRRVEPSFKRKNFFKNNREFCPFLGCEERGWCRAKERSCSPTEVCPPIALTEGCDSECLGGCTERGSSSSCLACKNFMEPNGNCVQTCPHTHLKYLNYRCLSPQECHENHWALLNPRDLAPGDEGPGFNESSSSDLECVTHCPDSFSVESVPVGVPMGIPVRTCRPKPGQKCGTATITEHNLGESLRLCSRIEGNLIIRVAGGKNAMKTLGRNLNRIESIRGYLMVFGADALLSLSFLPNLVSIEGQETVKQDASSTGYSLFILENPNLKELFHFGEKPLPVLSIGRGSVFIHFNDKLCDSEVNRFVRYANFPRANVSAEFNGHKSLCDVFNTHLKVSPGSTVGTVELSWYHTYCGVDERYVPGYHIFYRTAAGDVSLYEGREVCSNEMVWCRNHKVLEKLDWRDSRCMNHTITGLVPNTRYAIYVESTSVDVRTNLSIRSQIVYTTTFNKNPEAPANGRIDFMDEGLLVSWWRPELPSFSVTEDLNYELEITLERVAEVPKDLKLSENCQVLTGSDDNGGQLRVTNPTTSTAAEVYCDCCNASDTDPNPARIRNAIEIENEDDRHINFVTPSTNQKNRSRRGRDVSKSGKDRESACHRRESLPNSCSDPEVNFTGASSVRFSLSRDRSQWKKEGSAFSMSNSTNATEILVPYPKTLDFEAFKVTVKIRSCLGRLDHCAPLHRPESSCSLCSNFSEFTNHSVHYDGFPTFDVTSLPEAGPEEAPKGEPAAAARDCGSPAAHFAPKPKVELWSDVDDEVSTMNATALKVQWHSSPPLEGVTLGYRILYWEVAQDAKLNPPSMICFPKSVADQKLNTLVIPLTSEGNEGRERKFAVLVQAKTLAGFSPSVPKCLSVPYSRENEAILFLCYMLLGLGGLFLVGVLYKFHQSSCCYHKNVKVTENLNYGGELKDIKALYRLNDNEQIKIKDRILGGGKNGIVFEGQILNKSTGEERVVAVKTILEDKRLQDIRDILHTLRDIPEEAKLKLEKEINEVDKLHPEVRVKFSEKKAKDLHNEATLMQNSDSCFVVQLIKVSDHATGVSLTTESSRFLALEFMDNDLETFLKRLDEKNEALSEKQIIEIGAQVANGMANLSNKGYVHRDLYARNILLVRSEESHEGEPDIIRIKIGDFGLARYLGTNYYIQSRGYYIPVLSPPEVYKGFKWTTRSDVYSYGVLLYEMLSNCVLPHDFRTSLKQFDQVSDVLPKGTSNFLACVMRQCLQPEPRDRPTFLHLANLMLQRTSTEFQEWYNRRAYFPSQACDSSKSIEESDEGFPSNSLDTSQDENDFPSSSTPGGGAQRHEEDEEDEEEDDDDIVCLTPGKFGRDRSSCMSLNCVHNSLSCRRKRFSVSDDALSFN